MLEAGGEPRGERTPSSGVLPLDERRHPTHGGERGLLCLATARREGRGLTYADGPIRERDAHERVAGPFDLAGGDDEWLAQGDVERLDLQFSDERRTRAVACATWHGRFP
jgi:hypothetical protein